MNACPLNAICLRMWLSDFLCRQAQSKNGPPLVKYLLILPPQFLGTRVISAFALLVTGPMLTYMP